MADRLVEIQEIARQRGGRCLSERLTYPHKGFVDLECRLKHRWRTRERNLRDGAWCPDCIPGRKSRVTLQYAQAVALSQGGQCLSKECEGSGSILRFRCSHGHEWDTAYSCVVYSNTWCPTCSRDKRKVDIKKAQNFAKANQGACVSATCADSRSILIWECADGHRWEASYHYQTRQRTWCSKCRTPARGRTPRVSRTNPRRSRAQIRTEGLKRAHDIAQSRGGRCLSKIYRTQSDHLQWECAKGHRWKARTGNIIQVGSWCPICSVERGSLEDLRAIAERHGGQLVSDVYTGHNASYTWRCADGHVFAKRKARTRVHFCPECRQNERGLDRLRKTASKLAGESLADRWLGTAASYKWRCSAGHVFEASIPDAISQSCPSCAD